jgi:hypothetical protein
MIFAAEEYDAGASLHASYAPANQHIKRVFKGEERRNPLTFKFKI